MTTFDSTLSFWLDHPDEQAFEVELLSRPVEATRPLGRDTLYECHCGFQSDDRGETTCHRNAHCTDCGRLTFGRLSGRGRCGECHR